LHLGHSSLLSVSCCKSTSGISTPTIPSKEITCLLFSRLIFHSYYYDCGNVLFSQNLKAYLFVFFLGLLFPISYPFCSCLLNWMFNSSVPRYLRVTVTFTTFQQVQVCLTAFFNIPHTRVHAYFFGSYFRSSRMGECGCYQSFLSFLTRAKARFRDTFAESGETRSLCQYIPDVGFSISWVLIVTTPSGVSGARHYSHLT